MSRIGKPGEFQVNKKAVSVVISVMLMTGVAVSASILVYAWSMGLIGGLQVTPRVEQGLEEVKLDAYSWPSSGASSGTLTLILRNVGSANVTVDKIYVQGVAYPIGTKNLPIQSTITLTVSTGTGSYTGGVAYTVKVATQAGGTFTFSCIYGKSG